MLDEALRNFTDVLDNAGWGSIHWRFFAILAGNYFFDGIMFSVTPLLLYLIVPSNIAPIIFSLNLVSQSAGAIVLGILSDVYGRLKVFALSMALESGSIAALILLYRNPLALAGLTSLITFSIGGEFGASYAIIAELSPAKHRGKAVLLATNLWNLGSAVIAMLSIFYAEFVSTPSMQVRYLLLTALGTAVVAGTARLVLPESPRWLVLKGRVREAERVVRSVTNYVGRMMFKLPRESAVGLTEALSRYFFRFLVLAVVTLTVYITYDVTAFYIPYAPGFSFGEGVVGYVILYANLGSFLGAFLLIPLIDRSRKVSATTSLLGGFITSVFLILSNAFRALQAYYSFLFINMVFSEWAWASLSALESELFPTGTRSSVIGVLIALQGIAGASIVYMGLKANAMTLFLSVTALWLLGFLASLLWHVKGIESARLGIEAIEKPRT